MFMIRLSIITLLLALTVFKGIAQQVKPPSSPMKFDLGPQFSVPLNNAFSTTHSMSFGLTSRAAYYFAQDISVGVRINYDYFLGKSYTGPNEEKYYNLTWTSLLANFQYDFEKGVYIGGDAGFGLLNVRGSTSSTFNTSLYFGKAVKMLKSTVGFTVYWTQAREATARDEALGLRVAYRFN